MFVFSSRVPTCAPSARRLRAVAVVCAGALVAVAACSGPASTDDATASESPPAEGPSAAGIATPDGSGPDLATLLAAGDGTEAGAETGTGPAVVVDAVVTPGPGSGLRSGTEGAAPMRVVAVATDAALSAEVFLDGVEALGLDGVASGAPVIEERLFGTEYFGRTAMAPGAIAPDQWLQVDLAAVPADARAGLVLGFLDVLDVCLAPDGGLAELFGSAVEAVDVVGDDVTVALADGSDVVATCALLDDIPAVEVPAGALAVVPD